ncbi:uncharacterized protein LOC118200551 [Stegodyphus dumicola]|uniref:uncharacterized protein LOC118200551 n=1 Tax=Stegodyphus dumicola TaxID=202533 RepID=UPI0015A8900F|nr:uncharacterized protein LOC118200551 [Stegodyphus dumicola]
MKLYVFAVLLWVGVFATEMRERNEKVNIRSNSIENKKLRTVSHHNEESPFPRHLDINSLRNMPLIVLQPNTPIRFQLLPGDNLSNLQKSLNPNRIMELLKSATSSLPTSVSNPLPRQTRRQNRNMNLAANHPYQTTVTLPSNNHQSFSHRFQKIPVNQEPRSLLSPSTDGWFHRFKNSFSNALPLNKPQHANFFHTAMPSTNTPVFYPFTNPLNGALNHYPGVNQQIQSHHFGNIRRPFQPPIMDFSSAASYVHPTRIFYGNRPAFNPFRHNVIPQQYFGGNIAIPHLNPIRHRIPHPMHYNFARYVSSVPRHKPLFNNVEGLQAASLEISNAFADFADSPEHGPEVNQRFGSVGHSINNFLKMMGLGASDGFTMDDGGGFGGGADLAAMDSVPRARSLDFYPGYGNQAHLDDIEDFPIFHEDITEQFKIKMNLTNTTSSISLKKEDEKKTNDMKKVPLMTVKPGMEDEMKKKPEVSAKDHKNMKSSSDKEILKDVKISTMGNTSYAPALPLGTIRPEKSHTANKDNKINETQGPKQSSINSEKPTVNYKVPLMHPTVAPQDRKLPIAIYRNFQTKPKPDASRKSPKQPSYAPAQSLPHPPETEADPNKLVDDDVGRLWLPVTSSHGYVEKRPLPVISTNENSNQPAGLRVLQTVLRKLP